MGVERAAARKVVHDSTNTRFRISETGETKPRLGADGADTNDTLIETEDRSSLRINLMMIRQKARRVETRCARLTRLVDEISKKHNYALD